MAKNGRPLKYENQGKCVPVYLSAPIKVQAAVKDEKLKDLLIHICIIWVSISVKKKQLLLEFIHKKLVGLLL